MDPVVQLAGPDDLSTPSGRVVCAGRLVTAEDARKFRAGLMADRSSDRRARPGPPGRVMAAVAACRVELSRMGVPTDDLLEATEACVRARLAPRLVARGPGSAHALGARP